MTSDPEVLYEAETPLGFRVRVTKTRWELIIREKHPVMLGQEAKIRSVLESPEEVRQSRYDAYISSTRVRDRSAGSARW